MTPNHSPIIVNPNLYVPAPPAGTRKFDDSAIREWYRQAHINRTLKASIELRERYSKLDRGEMNLVDEMCALAEVYDDSDGDTLDRTSQLDHLLQGAEAARAAGAAKVTIAAVSVHDLAKRRLQLDGLPSYWNVGDTWPLGCEMDPRVVLATEYAHLCPDYGQYPGLGIYQPHCGLENVQVSFGHDEYGYIVFGKYLPEPVAWFIRFHSLYLYHREGGCFQLMNERDYANLETVRRINPFDDYSKLLAKPDRAATMAWLTPIVRETFPEVVQY